MRVGVVLTTYQGAPWILAQVQSIAAQTRRPDEVLVLDDGSTDDTVVLVTAALATAGLDSEVVVHPTRLGTVGSLEVGLRRSTADVVLLADQDDVWHPDRVERVLAALPPEGLLFHDADLLGAPGRLWETVGFGPARQRRLPADPLGVLLEGNPVTGATVAVSRAVVVAALPFPQQGWHDSWLALVAAALGHPVVALPEALLDYRVHAAQSAGLPPTGLRGRLRQAPAARTQRAVMVAMLGELASRLPEGPARQAVLDTRTHLGLRQDLPAARLRRLPAVARHLYAGGYTLHGGSWRTAVVDLLERRAR